MEHTTEPNWPSTALDRVALTAHRIAVEEADLEDSEISVSIFLEEAGARDSNSVEIRWDYADNDGDSGLPDEYLLELMDGAVLAAQREADPFNPRFDVDENQFKVKIKD